MNLKTMQIYQSGTYTDLYQLTMAQAYYKNGDGDDSAIFDYFFRKLPFGGGYAVFAGLEVLLEALEGLQFADSDLAYLERQGFDAAFLQYLRDFRFRGKIYSATEGDIVFPVRPVLTIEAPLIEAQLIETLLLNVLNYQTLIATKASRMRQIAGEHMLIDFGMRRAHGPAVHHASRAAVIGGFNATSNVLSGKEFGIPVSGTMAHSFVQSFDDELTAFRKYAAAWPDDCILLVDTYDTLKSGVPNAITVAKEMAEQGKQLQGIRLDSGDLAYLSKKARKMLDEAGLEEVKIAASNQLDEYLIRSLLDQDAPIDVFGVGTSLVTGQPDAALDGVYKLAFAHDKPRIKLSENTAKITLPHMKQVHRIYDRSNGKAEADVVTLWGEEDICEMHHPFDIHKKLAFEDCTSEPLLDLVMEDGLRTRSPRPPEEIAEFARKRLSTLSDEYLRFENPHIYKVGLSNRLNSEREELISRFG
jgi:nicotinate phosphoribosyltransferase